MLQLLTLGRPALNLGRRSVRTAFRRPFLVAAATGLAMLYVLPRGEAVLPVEMVDSQGNVERVFTLAVDDPQVEILRRIAEEASHPDYRRRSPDYYRAQWDAAAAEYYLAQTRATPLTSDAVEGTGTAAAASSTGGASRAVVPVAYQQIASNPHDAARQPGSLAATAGGQDWVAFWSELRQSATARMRSLEPAPRFDPMFARMRFGAVAPGPSPTATVFAALCIAVLAFLITARWACRPPRRLIGLRTEHRLEIPAEWIRQRPSWRERRAVWTGGRVIEASAVVVLWVLAVL